MNQNQHSSERNHVHLVDLETILEGTLMVMRIASVVVTMNMEILKQAVFGKR